MYIRPPRGTLPHRNPLSYVSASRGPPCTTSWTSMGMSDRPVKPLGPPGMNILILPSSNSLSSSSWQPKAEVVPAPSGTVDRLAVAALLDKATVLEHTLGSGIVLGCGRMDAVRIEVLETVAQQRHDCSDAISRRAMPTPSLAGRAAEG